MYQELLQNKTIVISGGTKGVGRSLALSCAEHGADVIIGGRDAAAAKEIIDQILKLGRRALFVPTNLKHADSCKLFLETAFQFNGKIDGFVNYAGITTPATLLECTPQQFDDIMDINFRAAFFCVQHAVLAMQKSGGSIILMSSCHALRGEKDRAAYACSKGALSTLSAHVSHHYAAQKIRCNIITMGWSPTEGELLLRKAQGISERELRDLASNTIPMGRMQEAADYIPAIIYLLSDVSSMVTGGNLVISGGLSL